MEISITLSSMVAMLGAMIVLATVPDASAFAVVSRSISSGFAHGLVTTIGILAGDIVFIVLAVYGLSTIADSMGTLFIIVKYLGGVYLIGLGISLWWSKHSAVEVEGVYKASWVSDFLCGLFITLGDIKAILFYISFLPVFLDLSRITIIDTGIIILIAAIALGIVKLGYAYMADRARLLFKSVGAKKVMNNIAGSVMIATGVFLVAKT